jgi:spore coat polysaccharide biosynthesis protein SpsF
MKSVAIIQARMGSTRLYGKVMRQLCGKTVLSHVISRVRVCPLVDEIVVATTVSGIDDVIAKEAEKCGAFSFRGSEHDVLERYYLAAKQFEADAVIRITSDCPLFDSEVLGEMLKLFIDSRNSKANMDYLSNTLFRTYPRGLDTEVFTFRALEISHLNAKSIAQREHVTPYIYQNPDTFNLRNYVNDNDYSMYRWTLDTEEDFQLIQEIYDALYKKSGGSFTTNDVLSLMEGQPELFKINAHIEQKKL